MPNQCVGSTAGSAFCFDLEPLGGGGSRWGSAVWLLPLCFIVEIKKACRKGSEGMSEKWGQKDRENRIMLTPGRITL